MSSNIAIQALNIGGNTVQPTPDGKFKVTTAKGKTKILTEDQFVRQIKKNEKNLVSGKDFEIKKGVSPLAKIVGFLAAAGTVTAAVVYRKNIAKWFQKMVNKFKPDTPAGYTKEFRKSRADALTETFKNYDGEAVVKGLADGKTAEELKLVSSKTIKRTDYTGKDFIRLKNVPNAPLTPRAQILKNNGLNEHQYQAMKAYAKLPEGTNKLSGARNDILPKWARDKETCTRYINSIEASIAKAEKDPGSIKIVAAATEAKPKKKAPKKATATETQTADATPKNEAPSKKNAAKAEQPKADDNKKA